MGGKIVHVGYESQYCTLNICIRRLDHPRTVYYVRMYIGYETTILYVRVHCQ